MSDETRLDRQVYIALAAVGWADGELDRDEADAIVRTALEDGYQIEEIAEIEKATKEPVAIADIDWRSMSKEDRLFVYAVASWMTRLDGDVAAGEVEALARLGEALHLPDRPREQVDVVALEIAELPVGDRPDRYDIKRLREEIAVRLEEGRRRARLAAEDAGEPPDASLVADGSTLLRDDEG